jgi:hypothetical protein
MPVRPDEAMKTMLDMPELGPAGSGGRSARVQLPFRASLVRRGDEVLLEYNGFFYGGQDALPRELLASSPYGARNGRQFVAHWMLLNVGSDAGAWPELARAYTGM